MRIKQLRLDLQNIRKEFNKTVAVDSLNLSIPEGTVFGLVGPNGAGKTTTIRMIMDILQPDSGTILFNGNPIGAADLPKIGYLPEERGLYRKMKLLDTIVYFGTLKGLSKAVSKQRSERYLDRFNLNDYANRKIEELSKGNQQKVQFIIAILHDPDLVILDEPFAGLDPVNQMILKELITEFHNAGKTIVFSTHQMEQVEKLCHDVCMIHQGQRVLYGNLKEIKKNYGIRKFRIQYEGNEKAVSEITNAEWTVTHDSISGDLASGLEINDVLQQIISEVTITHVDISEPSLEQIFIDLVKGGNGA
ncbi:MAG: ATP-binding cassette domain-containing protein [Candidatus Marinimicrobia bacterium]|nr:ATP-binding cassette domain-containing protein [Candidatus Neomarinimicrobiota bacterium]